MPNVPPNHQQYDDAARVAASQAVAQRVAMTVCRDERGGYAVMPSQEFAVLRENKADHFLHPIASMLPNGTVEAYHPFILPEVR